MVILRTWALWSSSPECDHLVLARAQEQQTGSRWVLISKKKEETCRASLRPHAQHSTAPLPSRSAPFAFPTTTSSITTTTRFQHCTVRRHQPQSPIQHCRQSRTRKIVILLPLYGLPTATNLQLTSRDVV